MKIIKSYALDGFGLDSDGDSLTSLMIRDDKGRGRLHQIHDDAPRTN